MEIDYSSGMSAGQPRRRFTLFIYAGRMAGPGWSQTKDAMAVFHQSRMPFLAGAIRVDWPNAHGPNRDLGITETGRRDQFDESIRIREGN